MTSDESDDAIEEAEERLGWVIGMRGENQRQRQGIHRALDLFEAGDTAGAAAKLRELVGRALQTGGSK